MSVLYLRDPITGEYMVWTDGLVHECIQNTNFSPVDYSQAWVAVE